MRGTPVRHLSRRGAGSPRLADRTVLLRRGGACDPAVNRRNQTAMTDGREVASTRSDGPVPECQREHEGNILPVPAFRTHSPENGNSVMGMSAQIDWIDIAVRLGLTVLAGLIIGFDRSKHGATAGLRNHRAGRSSGIDCYDPSQPSFAHRRTSSDSFVTMDLMRLPLGILTGVGFIGGGAILRRDQAVFGARPRRGLSLSSGFASEEGRLRWERPGPC
jgi:hypothetical protein